MHLNTLNFYQFMGRPLRPLGLVFTKKTFEMKKLCDKSLRTKKVKLPFSLKLFHLSGCIWFLGFFWSGASLQSIEVKNLYFQILTVSHFRSNSDRKIKRVKKNCHIIGIFWRKYHIETLLDYFSFSNYFFLMGCKKNKEIPSFLKSEHESWAQQNYCCVNMKHGHKIIIIA